MPTTQHSFYLYFIKKQQGQKGLSPLLLLIQKYQRIYGSNDFIFCWPGYMSSSVKNLKSFAKQFFKNSNIREGYFLVGMNGKNSLTHRKKSVSIQNFLNSLCGNYSLTIRPARDHSKIAVFLSSTCLPLPGQPIDAFLKTATVHAIAIGSSNQSKETYINSPAYKGEADVFLLDPNVLQPSNSDELDQQALQLKKSVNKGQILVSKKIGNGHLNLQRLFLTLLEGSSSNSKNNCIAL